MGRCCNSQRSAKPCSCPSGLAARLSTCFGDVTSGWWYKECAQSWNFDIRHKMHMFCMYILLSLFYCFVFLIQSAQPPFPVSAAHSGTLLCLGRGEGHWMPVLEKKYRQLQKNWCESADMHKCFAANVHLARLHSVRKLSSVCRRSATVGPGARLAC